MEGLYYLSSENKGGDQLCSYSVARAFVFTYAKGRFSHDTACSVWLIKMKTGFLMMRLTLHVHESYIGYNIECN